MINNLARSTVFQVTKSQIFHVKRLIQINSTRTTMFDFELDPQKSISQSRKNHDRSRSFKTLQNIREVKSQNRKLVMSMVKIAGRDTQFPLQKKKKSKEKHGNHFFEEKRRKQEIKKQNETIALRILNQKSQFSKEKDKQQFKQTRKIIRRLEKFNNLGKISDSLKLRERIISEPSSATSWDLTKKKLMSLYKNKDTQTQQQSPTKTIS